MEKEKDQNLNSRKLPGDSDTHRRLRTSHLGYAQGKVGERLAFHLACLQVQVGGELGSPADEKEDMCGPGSSYRVIHHRLPKSEKDALSGSAKHAPF